MFRCGFSALQRAEIAEMAAPSGYAYNNRGFSALQRAEIAEIPPARFPAQERRCVSVLFNEPKLLKSSLFLATPNFIPRFSALQRAEIAEIEDEQSEQFVDRVFQCSSTSRNC